MLVLFFDFKHSCRKYNRYDANAQWQIDVLFTTWIYYKEIHIVKFAYATEAALTTYRLTTCLENRIFILLVFGMCRC